MLRSVSASYSDDVSATDIEGTDRKVNNRNAFNNRIITPLINEIFNK